MPRNLAEIEAAEVAELYPREERSRPEPEPLPYIWFEEAEPNLEAVDFVEGVLVAGAMSVIYGPSNCGKTFFVLDMALHVAMGRQWRGREVDRGAIIYLSLEGSQGIRNRMAAFRKYHVIAERLPFVAMPKPISLLDSAADVGAVIALVEHVTREAGLPVAMVIVDTLSRAMAGGNENSPEDMTALIGNCDRIRHATGAHLCIVHHSGKDDAKGARGHSSLRAATDTEIEIKRDPEAESSTVRIAKQRELEAGQPFAFSLRSVGLGLNRRGKEVTSCVVVDADAPASLATEKDKLTPKEMDALRALDDCIAAGGMDVATGRNNDVARGVAQASWRRSLEARDILSRNNPNVARTQFGRIQKALVTKGKIEISDDHVWQVQQ